MNCLLTKIFSLMSELLTKNCLLILLVMKIDRKGSINKALDVFCLIWFYKDEGFIIVSMKFYHRFTQVLSSFQLSFIIVLMKFYHGFGAVLSFFQYSFIVVLVKFYHKWFYPGFIQTCSFIRVLYSFIALFIGFIKVLSYSSFPKSDDKT